MGRPVVIVTGPSGAGKNYLIDLALRALDGDTVHYLKSVTTRPPRTEPPEAARTDLETMAFATKAEFLAWRDGGLFLEWDLFNPGPHEQYYGTLRAEYERIGDGRVGVKSATEAFVVQAREAGIRVVHVAIVPENYVPRHPQRFQADLERAERGPKPDHRWTNDHKGEDRGERPAVLLAYLLKSLAASP